MLIVPQQSDHGHADRLRLPLSFDVARLREDLQRLEHNVWTRHFVPQNFEGDWSVLPLRFAKGETHPIRMIYSDPTATEFVDGPNLSASPYLAEVLAAFDCPLRAVRLMRLTPGSVIKEHEDHDLAADWGKARIHIPITTNPDVEFMLNGIPVAMLPGDAWYLRLSDPHRVANRGTEDRVHLVIDCDMSDWLERMLCMAAQEGERLGAGLYPRS
ncbi:aspartyl/asparaginyl beta-hydroxylase domain-containing protein [Sphingomonas colocasiae]|uniref:Aspartyl/asparaginyl beta-hydroxylase domain-containing protein n=1 Tax=Sphingomonas colocasiae TaxID=1848973 RepID=A0ABS7PHQ7_9SPHN|nr:aspartyl/asparaginyl beta-hydroxylase domain-containing protein [Sphingomonas colocasiae]MBY8820821.1 aspartyl/asparaginyl beta-hydroxylase domain-containing protein [Sphingomonas colocasiae]